MSRGFEQRIKELLIPLVQNNVMLYYPLFANTFPLAYYYAKYLKEYDSSISIDDYVIQKDWNLKTLPVASDANPFHIIFDTEWRGEKEKNGAPIQFTSYRPRFIFTDINSRMISFLSNLNLFSPYIDNRADFYRREIDDNAPILDLNLDIFRNLIDCFKINKVRIYTDIVDEAELVKTLIKHRENLPQLDVDIIESKSDWTRKV
ncbi:MAG: hypothetical protein JST32_20620, partial [Bacteroidetes bacterium]|nr:hypothetical protein [Bacteroidota bacterium]